MSGLDLTPVTPNTGAEIRGLDLSRPLPPETVADIRAALYSLGCTFHFLLAGQVPFPGGTLIQKLDKQRWATPMSADQLRPEVPSAVATVVRGHSAFTAMPRSRSSPVVFNAR